MNKKLLWLVLAVVLLLFALWPSNAFARGMDQTVSFPGFGWADYGLGMGTHSYSGQLLTYWWEANCGPGNEVGGESLCFYRRIFLLGWRIPSPADAILKVDFLKSNGPYRAFSAAVLPAWGSRYPSLVEVNLDFKWPWTILEGEREIFSFLVTGTFVRDLNCPPGIIISLKENGGLKFRDNYCGEVPI